MEYKTSAIFLKSNRCYSQCKPIFVGITKNHLKRILYMRHFRGGQYVKIIYFCNKYINSTAQALTDDLVKIR